MVNEFGVNHTKAFHTDVGSSSSIAVAVRRVIEWIAVTKAELADVVAAAGIDRDTSSIDRAGNALNMDVGDSVVRVNLHSSIDLVCRVLPYWTTTDGAFSGGSTKDADRGAIILVSSIAPFEGLAGMSAYSVSKGGLVAAVIRMAKDLAPYNIRVLSIAPGIFRTPLTEVTATSEILNTTENAVVFPNRLGRHLEFGSLVKHIYENVYLNATTIGIDGDKALRVPRSEYI